MIQLDLDDREQTVLCAEIKDDLADLRAEIGRTDSYDYRTMLKEREAVLNKIAQALDVCEEPALPR